MNPREIIVILRSLGSAAGDGGAGLVVALAIAVLVAGAVIVAVTLLRTGAPSHKLRSVLAQASAAPKRGMPSWVLRLVLAGVLAGVVASLHGYMGDPRTCGQCHRQKEQAASLKTKSHRAVACMDCHRPPGFTGAVRQTITYGRWLYVYGTAKQQPKPDSAEVEDGSCLRCHKTVSSGTLTSGGMRVRHSDFLEEGAHCVDCHSGSAHPDTTARATKPTMDKCLSCHDGEAASYECRTCHVKDVTANSDIDDFPKVRTSDKAVCYRCHDPKPCTSCHGVLMPHPEDWKAGPVKGSYLPGHANDGFRDRDVCFRCHYDKQKGEPFVGDEASCRCHGLNGRQHGGKPWVQEHGAQATGAKTGQFADCRTCHSDGFCTGCHDASYEGLYKPRGGDDSYRRDVPLDPRLLDF